MPASTLQNLGLKSGWAYLEDGWNTDMNSNLRALDTLVQCAVKDKDLDTPPGSPSNGDRYIVASGATAAWTGLDGSIVLWDAGAAAWIEYGPKNGWRVLVEDEGRIYTYSSATSAWQITTVVDATQFASLQAASNATPVGGVLYIPSGTYTPATSPSYSGLTIKSGTTVIGDGKDRTFLKITETNLKNTHLCEVTPDAQGRNGSVSIYGIYFEGPNVAADTDLLGIGLRIVATDPSLGWVSSVIVEDCIFYQTGSWGAYIESDAQFVDQISFRDTYFNYANRGGSIHLGKEGGPGANLILFDRCQFNGPTFGTYGTPALDRGAVHLSHCTSVTFDTCGFQNQDCGPAVSIASVSHELHFKGCHFETNTNVGDRGSHWITCASPTGAHKITFDTCGFYRYKTTQGAAILKVKSDGFINAIFNNCQFFSNKTAPVGTDDFVLASAPLAPNSLVFANITTEYPSGNVEPSIQNETGNFVTFLGWMDANWNPRWRFPKFTTTQRNAISSPMDGDIIFNVTNHTYEFYDANAAGWRTMNAGAA